MARLVDVDKVISDYKECAISPAEKALVKIFEMWLKDAPVVDAVPREEVNRLIEAAKVQSSTKMTYGDLCRRITDEQLANLIDRNLTCSDCPAKSECTFDQKTCYQEILNWLKKEAKEECIPNIWENLMC